MNIGAYVIGNFEEFAWRGVALPRLQATQPAVKAALGVGVIHAIWHLPYFFVPNSIERQLGPLVFLLWNIALSIIITWTFNNAPGSLLIAIPFHAANDGWEGLLMAPGRALPSPFSSGLLKQSDAATPAATEFDADLRRGDQSYTVHLQLEQIGDRWKIMSLDGL